MLYALSIVDVTMLLALAFVLARNVIKLVVERRRGLPFSRFRLKLVAALLGLTIVPSVLVLLAGSELIRQTTSRWFSQPVSAVLTSANAIASTLLPRSGSRGRGAGRRGWPRACRRRRSLSGDLDALKASVSAPVMDGRVGMVEIYRLQPGEAGKTETWCRSWRCSRRRCRPGTCAPRRIGWPRRSPPAARDTQAHEPLEGGGELVRAGVVVRDGAGKPIGVVIASDFLSGDLARHARAHRRGVRGLQPAGRAEGDRSRASTSRCS